MQILTNADVGQYSANPWGFFDMHGNVWEWTADWYAAYSSGAQTDPEGPATGSDRVFGAAPGTVPARTCVRPTAALTPQHPHYIIGFRVGFQQQSCQTWRAPRLAIVRGMQTVTQLQAGQAWADPGAVGAHDARDGNLTAFGNRHRYGGCEHHGYLCFDLLRGRCRGQYRYANRPVTVNVGTPHSVDLNASVAMEMLWVTAGTFTMGSPTTEAGREASKEHEHNVP